MCIPFQLGACTHEGFKGFVGGDVGVGVGVWVCWGGGEADEGEGVDIVVLCEEEWVGLEGAAVLEEGGCVCVCVCVSVCVRGGGKDGGLEVQGVEHALHEAPTDVHPCVCVCVKGLFLVVAAEEAEGFGFGKVSGFV
jgi:hypothetical protein